MYFFFPDLENELRKYRTTIAVSFLAVICLIGLIVAVFAFDLAPFARDPSDKAKKDNSETISTSVVEPMEGPNGEIPGRVGPTTSKFRKIDVLTVTQNGAVIEDVDVAGEIRVQANNVTIRNFRANNVRKDSPFTGLLLEDGEIHGKTNPRAYGVSFSEYTARRLNIYGVEDGFKAHGNVLIENSWVHDLAFEKYDDGGTTHNDGVQISSGSNIVVRNSRFEKIQGTAAVFIKPDQGAISNVEISSNILGGGAYTLYVISTPQFGYPTQVKITGNRFLSESLYGPINIENPSLTINENNQFPR